MAYYAFLVFFFILLEGLQAADLPVAIESYLETYTQTAPLTVKEEVDKTLQEALQKPYNLNTITREELENFPFLTAHQIENLLEYRFDHTEFLHAYELALIEEWDPITVELMLPFIQVIPEDETPKNFHKFFQYAEHNCSQFSQVKFPIAAGYNNQHYLGPPVHFGLQYQLNHPLLQINMSMENDAGEPFGNQYNKGFDFYGGCIGLFNLKNVQKLLIGDYRAYFGQGLVLSSTSFYGNSSIENIHQRRNQLQASYSYNEENFLRGIGMTVEFKNLAFSLISSVKAKDGAQGKHRTLEEWKKKQQGIIWGVGGNINYRWPFLQLGFSTYYSSPTQLAYFSLDYRGVHQFLNYSGEIAVHTQGKIATVHSISAQLTSAFSVGLQVRYIAPEYGQAFYSTNTPMGRKIGEYGGRLSMQAQWGKFHFLPSFELYRNVHRKATSHQPSIQYKAQAVLTYTPKIDHIIQFSYHWNSREQNSTSKESPISPTHFYQKHGFQCNYTGQFSNGLFVKTSGIAQLYQLFQQKREEGYLIYLDMGYKQERIKCVARLALFDIPLFANRISLYENQLPGQSSFKAYYSTGFRTYIYGSFQVARFCKIYLKLGYTYYKNKKYIGTGDELVIGPHGTDIGLLLQWNW